MAAYECEVEIPDDREIVGIYGLKDTEGQNFKFSFITVKYE